MAVQSENLFLPAGELSPDWLPDVDLQGIVAAAISAGENRDEDDETVTAFAYSRAYAALQADLMAQPASQRERDKSDAYLPVQFDYWARRADYWQCRYTELAGSRQPRKVTAGAVR